MTAFGPELPRFAELAPGVRRLLAPNPSMMTGPGTNTYLFGVAEIAVVDPGPDIDEHIDRIIETAGAPIRWVLATHTHPDQLRTTGRRTGRTGPREYSMMAICSRRANSLSRPYTRRGTPRTTCVTAMPGPTGW
jgi:hypothetical protein